MEQTAYKTGNPFKVLKMSNGEDVLCKVLEEYKDALVVEYPMSEDKFKEIAKSFSKLTTIDYSYSLPKEIAKLVGGYLQYQVLIVQIQTACEGLNLQQFKEIYFTGPHWNPAVEDQAVARCHRIGQKDEIDVFRFTMAAFKVGPSLDLYIQKKQGLKREMMLD